MYVERYRDGNKFKRRTLANLSHWPAAKIETLRRVLRDEAVAPAEQDALTLLRSLPHGHVAAAWVHCARSGSIGFYRRAVCSPDAKWR